MPVAVSGKRGVCCSPSTLILERSCAFVFSSSIGPCLGKENQPRSCHSNGNTVGGPGGEAGDEERAPSPPGPGKEGCSFCPDCLPLCLPSPPPCTDICLHRSPAVTLALVPSDVICSGSFSVLTHLPLQHCLNPLSSPRGVTPTPRSPSCLTGCFSQSPSPVPPLLRSSQNHGLRRRRGPGSPSCVNILL